MPKSFKRTVLTQEVLRILLRCSPKLPWEVTANHLSMFMMRMQYSGYNKTFRAQVLKSGLNAYENVKVKDQTGEQPMYRSREWKMYTRKREKRKKKNNWFKKGEYKSVMFIPPTPKSELKKAFETEIKKSQVKIKVVETSGNSLKNKLQRSHPFPNKQCNDVENCMVCAYSDKGGCRTNNVTYEIKCGLCDSIYIGETARNAYSRGREHLTAYRNKTKDSVLHRHTITEHKNVRPLYEMTVIGKHKTALERQIREAVVIDNTPDRRLMNKKSEWGHTRLVRSTLQAM